ncbi:hypothetical protein SLEP1_g28609 [Rubroshorea leprosula]|uniref:Uncharacterized protein n=1 Tax=Rubroshorea leprosula TaxID=152421 RepID=A0AAV5K4Z9_9ROSI|nr:hypothetical protein SLEP1_g28609 [Rubroshorea leprosula]
MKKKEKEYIKLQERLNQVLMEKKKESRSRMEIMNLLQIMNFKYDFQLRVFNAVIVAYDLLNTVFLFISCTTYFIFLLHHLSPVPHIPSSLLMDPKGKRKSSLQAEFDNTGSWTPMASPFAASVLVTSQLLNRSLDRNAKMKKQCDKVMFPILDSGCSEVLRRESFEFFRESASTYPGNSNITF